MNASDKITAILNWAEEHQNFDPSYVTDVQDSLEKFGKLTERQEEALDNIINGFKIELEDWLDDK